MYKAKILDDMYAFSVLYKNGLVIKDIVDNKHVFTGLCNELVKKNKIACDINLKFTIEGEICFEIKNPNIEFPQFQIELKNADIDLLVRLLFGQIKCSDFLYERSHLIENQRSNMDFDRIYKNAVSSWTSFVARMNYNEDDFFVSDEAYVAKSIIDKENIVWCYNKSCTGKTFLGIYTLTYSNYAKYVYNPYIENTCDISFIEMLLEYGVDCAILIDDLQCDIEVAKKLLDFISKNIIDIKKRNLHIFIISWSSMRQVKDFLKYVEVIPTIETKPQKFINVMKNKISSQGLLKICDNNLALISTVLRLEKRKQNSNKIQLNNEELFNYFVQTLDKEQLKLIHILAVLGTYEFETPLSFIQSFGNLNLKNIITAKVINNSIFLAHRTIANYIARHIENKIPNNVFERKEIIKKYINYIDNRKKWKALIHLIGENDKTEILSVSPIWNLMYEFQNNLKKQTTIDPSWENTPSSMYFVISTAKMLGVVDEYKDVVDALCSNFIINESSIEIKYEALKTTFDFLKIKERMIIEDKKSEFIDYEKGEDINLEKIHKNWLYGLMIGLKSVLIEFGYEDLIRKIELELLHEQSSFGYWYPKRVPWVTARILIGLSDAGYSIKNDFVKKGIIYLTDMICDKKWEAHTGGWNNEFETSSLCLEALNKCGADCEDKRIKDVVEYLSMTSNIWMSEDNEIDGATTACVLMKILGIQNSLLSYIKELIDRNIHNIVDMVNELDYSNSQSCKTTQIAYYVIELCWYILEKDISGLLDDFIVRAELEMEDTKMKKQLFISYSEDSPYHIKRVSKIVEHLESEGYIVYFYANAPLGTNNMEFMQNINKCDATIVIGTKNYKNKSTEIKSGGVFFEACVLSREFMNNNYEKIVPIAFDEFNESFPEPFAINKGMRVKRVTQHFLKNLSSELKKKF